MTTIPSHTEVFRNVNIVVVQEVAVNVNIAVVQEVRQCQHCCCSGSAVNVNIVVVQEVRQCQHCCCSIFSAVQFHNGTSVLLNRFPDCSNCSSHGHF